MLRTASASRISVELQKPHTAMTDAAERNATGAPQFGQAIVFMRRGKR